MNDSVQRRHRRGFKLAAFAIITLSVLLISGGLFVHERLIETWLIDEYLSEGDDAARAHTLSRIIQGSPGRVVHRLFRIAAQADAPRRTEVFQTILNRPSLLDRAIDVARSDVDWQTHVAAVDILGLIACGSKSKFRPNRVATQFASTRAIAIALGKPPPTSRLPQTIVPQSAAARYLVRRYSSQSRAQTPPVLGALDSELAAAWTERRIAAQRAEARTIRQDQMQTATQPAGGISTGTDFGTVTKTNDSPTLLADGGSTTFSSPTPPAPSHLKTDDEHSGATTTFGADKARTALRSILMDSVNNPSPKPGQRIAAPVCRARAADWLGVGPRVDGVRMDLWLALADPDPGVRRALAQAQSHHVSIHIPPTNDQRLVERFITALSEILVSKHCNPEIARSAAQGLGALGVSAQSVATTLASVAQDKTRPRVAEAANHARSSVLGLPTLVEIDDAPPVEAIAPNSQSVPKKASHSGASAE